jgi:hypothetical protein
MALPSLTEVFNTVNTIAGRYVTERRFVDNISNATPLLQELKRRQKTYPGGEAIYEPLEYALNPNRGSFSGTDTFSVAQNEWGTKARFTMKDVYASFTITGDDVDKCSGPEALMDLIQAGLRNMETSGAYEMTTQLMSDGTGNSSKDITGLKAVCDDSTSVDVYGGITRSVETWWKGKKTTLSDYISLAAIQAMDGDLTDGNKRPQLRLTTQDVWDDLYEILSPYQRDYANKETAKFGYQKIIIAGIPIVVDAQCPSGEMLFLNFDYIKLRPHSRYANWHWTGWKEPVNQDMRTGQSIWKGNLTCSNCRYQGRIVSITT